MRTIKTTATFTTITTFAAGAIAMLAVMSRGAIAQAGTGLIPSVYVGGAVPAGNNSTNDIKPGFTLGAAMDVGPSKTVFMRAEASYTRFGNGDEGSESNDLSGRINAVIAGHNAHLEFTPYAVGGIGVYHVRRRIPNVDYVYGVANAATASADVIYASASSDGTSSSNKFGWNAGAGVEIPGGALASRLEVRYHRVAATDGGYQYLAITWALQFGHR
ncbi:MAG TPA: hypothetical protein VGM67_15260 [Gemmatimonadaceae bacterium]|jgi:opacity protein-like surface antigen